MHRPDPPGYAWRWGLSCFRLGMERRALLRRLTSGERRARRWCAAFCNFLFVASTWTVFSTHIAGTWYDTRPDKQGRLAHPLDALFDLTAHGLQSQRAAPGRNDPF